MLSGSSISTSRGIRVLRPAEEQRPAQPVRKLIALRSSSRAAAAVAVAEDADGGLAVSVSLGGLLDQDSASVTTTLSFFVSHEWFYSHFGMSCSSRVSYLALIDLIPRELC